MSSVRIAPVLAGAAVGGAENFYARFVAELTGRTGFEVRAFTRANERRERKISESGAQIKRFRFGGKLDVFDHWRYRQSLRRFKPDVVMTFMNRATQLTPAGDYQLVARLGHYYDLKYYRHCNHWVGITQGICNHLISGGMPAENVHHIPNFIDETPGVALPRDSFSTPTDEPLLLAFGRLHTNKGFDVLLRALSQLDQGILWLAGSGPEEAALKALAKEIGVEHRVRFLGWRDDINDLLATADVFICPSRHEGLGSILLESWFNCCPVVAAASQGPSEVLTHEETGMLVPVDDHVALKNAILQVIGSEQLAQRLVSQGRGEYDQTYSAETIIDAYRVLFETITKT